MKDQKKILVTGGAGYVGSVLVGVLLSHGFKVRVLDRFMFGGESLLSYVGNKNLEILEGDIRNDAVLEKAIEDVYNVVHLAALVGEPACRKNPEVTKQINFEATKRLALIAKKHKVTRFIFSSTCSNYGISSFGSEATEESALNPLSSLYSETKIAAENFLLLEKSTSFHPTIFRLATIFGLSPCVKFNLLVNEFAREAALNGKIAIQNKKSWRPFLHVQDASNAFLLVLNAPLSLVSGQIYNVVGENFQKGDLVSLIKKKNKNVAILIEDSKKNNKRDYRVSAKKIKDRLHWRASFSVEAGFNEIFYAVKKGMFIDPYGFRHNAWFDDKVFQQI